MGLFVVIFIGVPWHVIVADDPGRRAIVAADSCVRAAEWNPGGAGEPGSGDKEKPDKD